MNVSMRTILVILLLYNYQELVFCKTKVVNFSKAAKQFAECIAAKESATLKWWSVNATKKFFKKNPNYQGYKITVSVPDAIKYGKKDKVKRQEMYFFNETRTNNNKLPDVLVLQKTVELKYNYTWKVKRVLKTGFPLMVNVGIPPYRYLAIKNNSIDLANKHKQSYNKTESVLKMYPYSVEPKTKETIKIRVTAMTARIPWQANIVINGFIAVALKKDSPPSPVASGACAAAIPVLTYKDIHFYKIDSLSNDVFRNNNAGGLNFTAKGFVDGVDRFEFKFISSNSNNLGNRKVKPRSKKTKKPKNKGGKKKPLKKKPLKKKPVKKGKPGKKGKHGKKSNKSSDSLKDSLKILGKSILNSIKSFANKTGK